MIPLRKYSYAYLDQLKFSSGAFILFVNVTTLRVKGMIWKGTHVLIKDLTADNAYQSKNQAQGQKQVCVKPHIWGGIQKNILLH